MPAVDVMAQGCLERRFWVIWFLYLNVSVKGLLQGSIRVWGWKVTIMISRFCVLATLAWSASMCPLVSFDCGIEGLSIFLGFRWHACLIFLCENYMWIVLEIRVPFRVRFTSVPYHMGDLKIGTLIWITTHVYFSNVSTVGPRQTEPQDTGAFQIWIPLSVRAF